MAVEDPKTLVSTAWLAAHLKDPDLRFLDGSWYLPTMQRNARAEFEAAHIPGARYFDIDDISDHRSELPHMVPPVGKFLSRMRAMGVGDGHHVAVADNRRHILGWMTIGFPFGKPAIQNRNIIMAHQF